MDAVVERLTNRVSSAIHQLTPVARSCPHSKRWWTPELTALRDMYTWARNRCTRAHRCGLILPKPEDTAWHLRRRYHQAIRDTKRRHWKEFLSEANNIWEVARYLEPGARAIPALCSGGRTTDDDQGKAQALLETSFPPLPSIQSESVEDRPQADALAMEAIAPYEIETALMRVASWKAPGPDGLPVV